MERIKFNLYKILGSIYIPTRINQNEERKILHISDTPQMFFPALKTMLNNICPDYIIHTGDLVDNIKLGLKSNQIDEYEKGVKNLLDIMENSSAQQIFISLGNHDNEQIIEKYKEKSIIFKKSKLLLIDDIKINISHYAEEILKYPAAFNLFGHDIILSSKIIEGKVFLNGIQNINIITTKSKQVFTLPYPLGTNDSRLGKFKFGM